MAERPNIVVIGSANIDLIMCVQRVPLAGETLHSANFSTAGGGKGANQAVACARLGADVEFIGRIGKDLFGEMILQSLKDSGVSISHLIRDPSHHTGTTVILVDSEGQNTMIPDFGANLHLSPKDIEGVDDVIEMADILLLQHEVPESVNLQAITIAERFSVPVILNPAPRIPSNLETLKKSYLITPNLVEAVALSELTGTIIPKNKSKIEKAESAASALLSAGIERIVVTLGVEGSLYCSPKDKSFFKAFKVSANDCTAAGDSFTASLAYCLAKGLSIEEAIQFASKAAAITVSRAGAQPSLPTLMEVINFKN